MPEEVLLTLGKEDRFIKLKFKRTFHELYLTMLRDFFKLLTTGEHSLASHIRKMKVIEPEEIQDKIDDWTNGKKSGDVKITMNECLFLYTIFYFIGILYKPVMAEEYYQLNRTKFDKLNSSFETYRNLMFGIVNRLRESAGEALSEYAEYYYRKNYLDKEFPKQLEAGTGK